MKKRSTLERQMLIYFGFIAAASLLITVEFVWAVKIIMSRAEQLLQAPAVSSDPHKVIDSLALLQNKAFLMGVVQAVVTLIVLMMLIRRITWPLRQMVDKARRISEGDLSQTIGVVRHDEIGLLGETINGLTSNIQEIVAFGLAADASLAESFRSLRKRTRDDAECRSHLDKMEETLSGFRQILDGFELLPAPPADTKASGS